MNYRFLLSLVAALFILNLGHAQVKTISLKKGEAIDLLLLSTNTEAEAEQKEYFEKAVPIAQEWGYRPQYSSRITEPPTQGNYWPKVVIIAKWQDYDKRIQFTEDIVSQYPQFHERRRQIWPTFDLTYWKVEEDQEIPIAPEKFYVATCYWSNDDAAFASFENTWTNEVTKQGGKIVLELEGGLSPFGYYYNPEHFTVTEWSSREEFEAFHKENLKMNHTGVKHVNQFIL